MQPNPIDDLQSMTAALWARSGLADCMQVARKRQDDGSAHVEFCNGLYDIVITERGSETERMRGLSRLDAARWFVFQMARDHASSIERRDRRRPRDAPPQGSGLGDDGYSRWNWMAPTIEVMRRIAPAFGDWAAEDFAQVLRRYPLTESERRNARYPVPGVTD